MANRLQWEDEWFTEKLTETLIGKTTEEVSLDILNMYTKIQQKHLSTLTSIWIFSDSIQIFVNVLLKSLILFNHLISDLILINSKNVTCSNVNVQITNSAKICYIVILYVLYYVSLFT